MTSDFVSVNCPECGKNHEIEEEIFLEDGAQEFEELIDCDCGCLFAHKFSIEVTIETDVFHGDTIVQRSMLGGDGRVYFEDRYTGDLFANQR